MSADPTGPTISGAGDDDLQGARERPAPTIAKIAIGVNGRPESRDAVVLGNSLARVLHAEVLLVGVHPEPLVVLPDEMNWAGLERQTAELLTETRDTYAPDARVTVTTGLSVPRALERVVMREHRDLLVIGSSRNAAEGRVRIGDRTRQLLSELNCALAIAPWGIHRGGEHPFLRIGVGYDGGEESDAALALAASLARAADADLIICGIVDDRIPVLGWPHISTALASVARREERTAAEMDALRAFALSAANARGAKAQAEILHGQPADSLLKLSETVDLLVIGSRRWGAVARVLLGGTGEALAHNAACPLLVVPRVTSRGADRRHHAAA